MINFVCNSFYDLKVLLFGLQYILLCITVRPYSKNTEESYLVFDNNHDTTSHIPGR